MNNSNFLLFFQELIQRLRMKSPRLFQIFNIINIVLFCISGIPWILQESGTVELLPERWMQVVSRIVAVASGWGYFLGKLTVARPPIDVQQDAIINKTPIEKLPFTAKKEAEELEKTEALK